MKTVRVSGIATYSFFDYPVRVADDFDLDDISHSKWDEVEEKVFGDNVMEYVGKENIEITNIYKDKK